MTTRMRPASLGWAASSYPPGAESVGGSLPVNGRDLVPDGSVGAIALQSGPADPNECMAQGFAVFGGRPN